MGAGTWYDDVGMSKPAEEEDEADEAAASEEDEASAASEDEAAEVDEPKKAGVDEVDEADEPVKAEVDEAAKPSREGARERRAKSRRRAERKPQRVAIDVTAAPKARKKRELTVRATVVIAAALGAAGIAIVGTRESVLGEVMVVGGMLGLIAAIHMFGRLGPDEAV